MASVVVVVHPHDRFTSGDYMLQGLFPHWIEAGHIVVVHEGVHDLPPADVVVLHVDLTVVPKPYLEALTSRGPVVNGATRSIAKRGFSRLLLKRGDAYPGPVILKTDNNCGGMPELRHLRLSGADGPPAGSVTRFIASKYPVLSSLSEVPDEMFDDPSIVVERFCAEHNEAGDYFLRCWTFFGDRERCTRYRARVPVIKASDVLEREPCPVPDELRVWRRQLGFDFGKFDFVLHDGEALLLDVNRTPTAPSVVSDVVHAGMAHLAQGLDAFL